MASNAPIVAADTAAEISPRHRPVPTASAAPHPSRSATIRDQVGAATAASVVVKFLQLEELAGIP